jgi:hypothetical protein
MLLVLLLILNNILTQNLHFLLVYSWIKSLQIFKFAFLSYHDFLHDISTQHPITQAI